MALPRPLDVAIQGERGAFSEEAARALLRCPLRIVPSPDFPHMFSSVARHRAHVCLAPMENSLVGSIFQNYDLLLQYAFRVRGEVYLRIEHCLVAPVGTYLEDIRRVYSHPVALDQCQEFLRRHPEIEIVSTYDTAGSVQMLVDRQETGAAAIAGAEAARKYSAKVLRSGIEDDPSNYTRFFLLSLADSDLDELAGTLAPDRVGSPKTSLVFHVENAPGSLHAALAVFAEREIDLTKIESRPVRGKPFEYVFYLDFYGSPAEPRAREALAALMKRAGFVQILGSYPSGRLDWVGEGAPLLPRRPTEAPADPT
ncbi:MAG TPA: prephenate dehydratase domain-containing protein [Gemmatimonadota bacterium]|nr:prephenate dehydratase domain-containing protein [Gemmatimonadota bacterium]